MAVAIVVPGNGSLGRDGVYRITDRCRHVVERAARLAVELEPTLVVFSGWSPVGGISEAEQMRNAWTGPDAELVAETTARTTAENASRTLPLLLARGVERAVVVCTPSHAARARFFFARLYAAYGVETEIRTVPVARSTRALAWELVALTVRRAQLRAASAELERGMSGR
jgi:uncharacterized SAM-binding protein YcdF (DUF218 family)